MSTRTRMNKSRKPGVASKNKPSGFERHKSHKSVRRAAKMRLADIAEPEDLTIPRPVRTADKLDPSLKNDETTSPKKFRFWKSKAWKRRSNVRAQKARAYRDAAS